MDHDTAAFAVESIRGWWNEVGQFQYPQAKRLLISADGGESLGSRVRLWKWELQQLADQTGLSLTVCHLPPGTNKWNNTPHRLFAWISQNWRGKPLVSYAVILKLIGATTTEAGLTVPPPDARCPMKRWRRSLFCQTPSTANGTIAFCLGQPKLILLFFDKSLVSHRYYSRA